MILDYNKISLGQALRTSAEQYAELPAIRFPGFNLSFAEVNQQSDALAAALVKIGIQTGDRVGLYCINCAEFAVVYCAIIKAGAVVVPINLLITINQVSYIAKDAGIKALFYHSALSEKAISLRSLIQEHIQIAIDPESQGADFYYPDLLQTPEPSPVVELDPQKDLAAILYTSGTTGFPKGAMLSHTNLLSNTCSVKTAMQFRSGEDCLFVVLPMFHSFAATVGMLTPLIHGLSFTPVVKFDPNLIAQVLTDTQSTIFLGVPSMYNLLLKQTDAQVANWSSVRFAISGAAALPFEVMQKFEEKFGFPIYEGDGPTECSPVTCINPIDGVCKPGSVGLAIPDVYFRICDDDGNDFPQGEIGEICVKGPNVMRSYWQLPKETKESFFGEWFRTGDLGYLDEDDYLFMVDRKKDMIIVNGMNVYPRIIEELLYSHEQIVEAAVVGEPDERRGEKVIAHVVLTEQAQINDKDIRNFCRANLGRHEIPRQIIIRDSLPKNATGKILKRELRKEGEIERGIC